MSDPLGSDLATLPDGDLDPRLEVVEGIPVLEADLRAEVLTPAGALFYAPEYGVGLPLAARVTDGSRAALAARIEARCLADDRVASADVAVEGELAVTVDGIASTGQTFAFVVSPADLPARLVTP